MSGLLVSVPSRGILFPNNIVLGGTSTKTVMFPSPLGVSYFQIKRARSYCLMLAGFPSPLGVSYFQITLKHLNGQKTNFVSVPSRGILFPNYVALAFEKKIYFRFPSPLGVSYFQILVKAVKADLYGFPSPLGVSYFQIKEK